MTRLACLILACLACQPIDPLRASRWVSGKDEWQPAPAPLLAIIYGGQSNCKGNFKGYDPEGTSDARYWLVSVGIDERSGFGTLTSAVDGTHGAELQLGIDLTAAGQDSAIVKVTKGGTGIKEWQPGTVLGERLLGTVAAAQAALVDANPGRAIEWRWLWYQGEDEAIAATEAGALAWDADLQTIHVALAAIVGPLMPVITRIHADTNGPWTTTVRTQQEHERFVSVDDLHLAGGIHLTAGAQSELGHRQAAELLQ